VGLFYTGARSGVASSVYTVIIVMSNSRGGKSIFAILLLGATINSSGT